MNVESGNEAQACGKNFVSGQAARLSSTLRWPSRRLLVSSVLSHLAALCAGGCYPGTPEDVLQKFLMSPSAEAYQYLTEASRRVPADVFIQHRIPGKGVSLGALQVFHTGDAAALRIRVSSTSTATPGRTYTLISESGRWHVAWNDSLVFEADRLISEQRENEATRIYKEALLIDPFDGDCEARFAVGLLNNREDEAAKGFVKAALEHEPESGMAYLAEGILKARNGELPAAETALRRSIKYTVPSRSKLLDMEQNGVWVLAGLLMRSKRDLDAKNLVRAELRRELPPSDFVVSQATKFILKNQFWAFAEEVRPMLEAGGRDPETRCWVRLLKVSSSMFSNWENVVAYPSGYLDNMEDFIRACPRFEEALPRREQFGKLMKQAAKQKHPGASRALPTEYTSSAPARVLLVGDEKPMSIAVREGTHLWLVGLTTSALVDELAAERGDSPEDVALVLSAALCTDAKFAPSSMTGLTLLARVSSDTFVGVRGDFAQIAEICRTPHPSQLIKTRGMQVKVSRSEITEILRAAGGEEDREQARSGSETMGSGPSECITKCARQVIACARGADFEGGMRCGDQQMRCERGCREVLEEGD